MFAVGLLEEEMQSLYLGILRTLFNDKELEMDSRIILEKYSCSKCNHPRSVDKNTAKYSKVINLCDNCMSESMEKAIDQETTVKTYIKILLDNPNLYVMAAVLNKEFEAEFMQTIIGGESVPTEIIVYVLSNLRNSFSGKVLESEYPGIIDKAMMATSTLSSMDEPRRNN